MPTKGFSYDIIYGICLMDILYPTKIIRNGPAVIVFWKDKTKTVVKKMDTDEFDVYAAVAQAAMKKWYGSTTKFQKVVKDHLKIQDKNYNPLENVMPKPTKGYPHDKQIDIPIKTADENDEKLCLNCAYSKCMGWDEPCCYCFDDDETIRSKWEAKK